MSCPHCQSNPWRQKIGRCAFCRYSSSAMTLMLASLWYYSLTAFGASHVYSLAAILGLLVSASLSLAHWWRFVQLRHSPPPP